MSKLPQLSGRECISVLIKAGFLIERQKGSHVILRRENPYAKVVVPDHKVIDKGTLRAIIRQAEMTVDEFIALL
jgi:predicted RNA binding protein YcfA (HicA-like mRNA interferase family)